MTPLLIALLVAIIAVLVVRNISLNSENVKLRDLNRALMDGAARRLVDDIKPGLQAAFDRMTLDDLERAEAKRRRPAGGQS